MDTKTYEGMFLLDSTQVAQDWDNLRKQVIGMLERRGGVVINAKRWAERKLAYEIKGHKRGTYFLVYFQMDPTSVATFRRDLQLSEIVIRNLIIVHPKDFKVPEGIEGPIDQPETLPEQKNLQSGTVKDIEKIVSGSYEEPEFVDSPDARESTDKQETDEQ